MSRRAGPLNAVQLEVLNWVKDDCPEDVYSDWSHRVSARALHNRGLIEVRGRGEKWSAALTDDGRYYLEHGSYPDEVPTGTADDPRQATIAEPQGLSEPPPPQRSTLRKAGEGARRAKQPNKTEQFILALNAAVEHRLVVERSEEASYRRLITLAKHRGLIPDGMQITLSWPSRDELALTLEPLPEWQTRALDPIAVPGRLHNPSDVTTALSKSDTFQVTGDPRKRALRLTEALTVAAREREMSVKAVLNQPRNPNNTYRDSPRRDEIEFSIEGDSFRLWFTQDTLREPHEPTQREIMRVQRGSLFPDYDEVPAERLGLVLNGEGGTFWAGSWHDAEDHGLEEDLAQILEELRLRHDRQIENREAEQERALARREQEKKDRAVAKEKYRAQFTVDAMKSQAEKWEEADRLRRYAAAIREVAAPFEGQRQEAALEWAAQVEAEASRINPLPHAAKPPEIPEPSHSDLSPFMKSRSLYGW
ncbi:hypothetical protein EG850_12765 [Gulosibacter macacae]|uniref:PE-PGRS family protein n=1 Tax=Gulosibacter macacae TaxID=2488791 RepID=A0A3P3VVD9_9MICO|nr:hypothetical protein [Gulosibacter macacae]RRJ85586.1 hypothetical protein EG850_12765 [Gulosibacter macacae]